MESPKSKVRHSVAILPKTCPPIPDPEMGYLGSSMNWPNQAICRQCERGMRTVATIEPIGSSPGLVALRCANCGATDSILVYPTTRIQDAEIKQHADRIPAMRFN
jgi:hypothetical protein